MSIFLRHIKVDCVQKKTIYEPHPASPQTLQGRIPKSYGFQLIWDVEKTYKTEVLPLINVVKCKRKYR